MKFRLNELLITTFFLIFGALILSEEPISSIVIPKEVPSETLVTTSATTTTDSAIMATSETAINTNNENIKKVEESNSNKEDKYSLDNYEVLNENSQSGKASYYAKKFHGNKTSNGEKFSIYEMTAAHRTLPFGTMIKVTNTDNNKSVVVRINDRGPFTKSKIIDLSPAAFEKLANLSKGVLNVKIEVLKKK